MPFQVGMRPWSAFITAAAMVLVVLAGPVAQAQTTMQVGGSISGSLSRSDDVVGGERYVDLYQFQGRAGQRIELTVTTSAFNSIVAVGDGGSFFEVDDGGRAGTNASLVVTLPSTGRFLVTVSSVELAATGSYTFRITDVSGGASAAPADLSGLSRTQRPSTSLPPPAFASQDARSGVQPQLQVGASVSGSLGAQDDSLETGSYVDAYRLQGRAGQRIRLSVQANGFNEIVAIGSLDGTDFFEVHDSTVDGSDYADLVVVLPRTGEYMVLVNARYPAQSGSYTLWVADGR